MYTIITIILGIVFIGLVIRALFHTVIGLCKIALGLTLLFFGAIIEKIVWAYYEIKHLWYIATYKG